jgi:predicted transcriptional regulator
LDVFLASAKILSAAVEGVSYTRIVSASGQLRHDEMKWLLEVLIEKRLLELDSSMAYWTTVDGIKFLEIQSNMERILQAQKSLV